MRFIQYGPSVFKMYDLFPEMLKQNIAQISFAVLTVLSAAHLYRLGFLPTVLTVAVNHRLADQRTTQANKPHSAYHHI